MSVKLVLLALLQVTFCLSDEYPPCYSDMDQCISNLKDLLVDDTVFWFGNDFGKACPPALLIPECTNPDRERHNIISRLYNLTNENPKDYVSDELQVTHVTFNSPEGSYYACGHTWESEAVYNYKVDPTRVMTIGQWAMDHMPSITWDTSKDSVDTMYSMIVWDAGFFYTHGIYINIKNGDLSTGMFQTIVPFFGPKVPVLRPNVYVFTVFKQTGTITTNHAYQAYSYVFGLNLGSLPLLSFLDLLPMNKELIAANIMVVPGDAYGLQFQKDSYVLNKCPTLISQAPALKSLLDVADVDVEWTQETNKLNNVPKPYIKTLSVDMAVTYRLHEDVHVESCCSKRTYMRSVFIVDPLSDRSVRSVRASNRPRVKLTPINIMGDRYDSFKTKPYTLMLVDIMPQGDGTANFVVHWMVNNILSGNVDTGEETLSYVGPSPYERTKPHAYIFLLFEQTTAKLDLSTWSKYVSDQCPGFLTLRCGKDFGGLLKTYDLNTIRGVSWFTAAQDGYSRKLIYNDYRSMMKHLVCHGLPGYEDPCPEDNYPSSSSAIFYEAGVLLVTTSMAICHQ